LIVILSDERIVDTYQPVLVLEDMEQVDIYTDLENKFDRLVYQNDFFFWFLVLLYLLFYIADWANWVAEGSGFVSAIVVTVFAISWIYTNARRRGMGRLGAGLFGLLTFVPLFGGIIFFIFRPKKLVVTFLPPKKQYPFPVPIGDQAFMLFRVPFRFLLKLVFWMMGVAFFIIGILSMFGKV